MWLVYIIHRKCITSQQKHQHLISHSRNGITDRSASSHSRRTTRKQTAATERHPQITRSLCPMGIDVFPASRPSQSLSQLDPITLNLIMTQRPNHSPN